MEKTSKVTKVEQNVKSWSNSYGTMFDHNLEMENGDKGVYSSKSADCKYKVGSDITYTIQANGNFPSKIKPVQGNNSFSGGWGGAKYEPKNQEVITALSCLSSASTLYSLQKAVTVEQVIATADAFYVFAMGKSKVTETPKA